jgi:hypothetical protein
MGDPDPASHPAFARSFKRGMAPSFNRQNAKTPKRQKRRKRIWGS